MGVATASGEPDNADVKKVEEYDEMVRNFASALTIEQRLTGLAPEQRLPVLHNDPLRALSDDYLRSLPADVQEAIYKRIGHPSK